MDGNLQQTGSEEESIILSIHLISLEYHDGECASLVLTADKMRHKIFLYSRSKDLTLLIAKMTWSILSLVIYL